MFDPNNPFKMLYVPDEVLGAVCSNGRAVRYQMKTLQAAKNKVLGKLSRDFHIAVYQAGLETASPKPALEWVPMPAAVETPRSRARAQRAAHIVARPVQQKDWRQLKAVFMHMARDTKRFCMGKERRNATRLAARRNYKRAINHADGKIIGFFHGGRMIGSSEIVLMATDKSEAHVGNTWIAPAYRGLALTDKLLQPVMQWIERHPEIEIVTTGHVPGNVASKAANQRMGFVRQADQDNGSRRYQLRVRKPAGP